MQLETMRFSKIPARNLKKQENYYDKHGEPGKFQLETRKTMEIRARNSGSSSKKTPKQY